MLNSRKMFIQKLILTFLMSISLFTLIGWVSYKWVNRKRLDTLNSFQGSRAFKDVEYQVALGPRTPGSQGQQQLIQWVKDELSKSGWEASIQDVTFNGHDIKNIIGKRQKTSSQNIPWIILGAHYDTRMRADRDSDSQKAQLPVPGANDGASGVAVILELGRVVPKDFPVNLWLLFFDAEDNGHIDGWDWSQGSRAFVKDLVTKPDVAIIVDMIGDANLNIYLEGNSTRRINEEIWAQAAELGYKEFIPIVNYYITDDHTPFLEQGIPAVDIIDIDYPYWHTSADTPDKVSAKSLEIVGKTLISWLKTY